MSWDEYSEVIQWYAKAERKIKELEYLDGILLGPSVNQLRYAGYHLTRSFTENPTLHREGIIKALGHCKRAYYDGCEAAAMRCLKSFKRFQEQYENIPISHIVPDYESHCRQALALQERFRQAINVSDGNNREAHYDEINRITAEFSVIVDSLFQARERINKALKKERWIVGSIVGTLFLTVVLVVIALIK